MLRFATNAHEASLASLDFYNDRAESAELRGIISKEPDRRTDHMKYTLAISTRDGEPAAGNLLVKTARLPEYFYGDELLLRGELQTPFETDEFSYRDYLARYDIFSVIYYPRIEKISAGNRSLLFTQLFDFKRAFEAQINQVFPEPHASFEAGLLIGSRRGIPPDVLEDFNTTGLTHIIAVSGYNVALVIAFVTGLFGSLVARRWQFPLAVVFVAIFTLLVGANTPVLRAAIMGLLAFYALTSGRQTYAPLALTFTAAAMVAFNPRILLSDVGFQLSFAAVAGLLFVAPVFEKLLEKIPNKFAIRESLLMTLSAQVTAVPLIVFYFDRFSLISPLANVLVAPAIPLAMLVGFIAVVAGTIFLPAGLLVGFLAYGFAELHSLDRENFCCVADREFRGQQFQYRLCGDLLRRARLVFGLAKKKIKVELKMIKLPFSSARKKSESDQAVEYIKKHKKKLLENFASDAVYSPSKNPASFFMAGAPGAGKTETAIMLLKQLNVSAIRIDPDEIKKWIPEYQGSKSELFHRASSVGVEKIYDYAIAKKKSVILDATFADYRVSHKNIERSVNKKRLTIIFYVHQDLELSWEFTLKREKLEGRHVPREVFEYAYQHSGLNVVRAKREFKEAVEIYLVEKNYDATIKKSRDNIGADELENFLQA